MVKRRASTRGRSRLSAPDAFVAIDFETANHDPSSACAIAAVRVEANRIVRKEVHLIRPPSRDFFFTDIHGISWDDVRHEKSFAQVWRGMRTILDGAGYLAAHNASFDQRVLTACCRKARLGVPGIPFVCTVRIARAVWDIRPTKLPDVCGRLRIRLKHHDPASDAEACARIVLKARHAGWCHDP